MSKPQKEGKTPEIVIEDVCGDQHENQHKGSHQEEDDEEKTGLLAEKDKQKGTPADGNSDDEIKVEILNKDNTTKTLNQHHQRHTLTNKQSFHQQIRRIFIPQEDRQETSCCWRLCCCFYYMFCCCCCESNSSQITKNKFQSRFQKWFHSHSNDGVGANEDPLSLLIRLYAHDMTAIKDLERVRVNPDFTSQFRNDLEFYIPQLCSFYLRGDCEKPQPLVNLILLASSTSFFFAHRIWFYFQSMLFNGNSAVSGQDEAGLKVQFSRTKVCLQALTEEAGIQRQAEKMYELIYLQNSEEIASLIKALKLTKNYPWIFSPSIKLGFKEEGDQRGLEVKKILEDYNLGKYNSRTSSTNETDLEAGLNGLDSGLIQATDIVLQPFLTQIELEKQAKKSVSEDQAAYYKRMCLNGFLSTPKFIATLTDISETLISQTDRKQYLRDQLLALNQRLPASVYLPFVNGSTRNYALLHIVAAEAKVFQTKERAPLLLCIEAYRPEAELALIKEQREKRRRDKKGGVRKTGVSFKSIAGQQNNYLPDSHDPLDPAQNNNNNNNNYRANSWHSSHLTLTNEGAGENNLLRQPLMLPENPYLREQLMKQQQNGGGVARKQSTKEMKKKEAKKVQESTKELIKKSDIKASNPVKIDDIKRTEEYKQMQMAVPTEGTFNEQMQQSHEEFDQMQSHRNLLDQAQILQKELSDTDNVVSQRKSALNYTSGHTSANIMEVEELIENQPALIQPESKKDENELFVTASENLPTDPPMIPTKHSPPSHEGNFLDSNSYVNNGDIRYSNLMANPNNSIFTGGGGITSLRKESGNTNVTHDLEFQQPQQHQQQQSPQQKQDLIFDEAEEEDDKDQAFAQNLSEQQIIERRSNSERMPQKKKQQILKPVAIIEEEKDDTQLQYYDKETRRDSNALLFYNPQTPVQGSGGTLDNQVFTETSRQQDERVRKASPFGHLKTWRLLKIIVKSNDDVRQEQFAMQLIAQINQIFQMKKGLNMWLRPYEILATGQRCGLIEVVQDAMSIDSIKKRMGGQSRLIDFFHQQFGQDVKSKKYKKAQENFCHSLAAYSLVCYILQIKDRHNGNILIDIEGHIIHIDFGFLLSNAPGKGIKFEQAPFKLTYEMVEVLGGIESKKFNLFRELMRLGFMAIQENADKIIKLVEMMFMGLNDLPCFGLGENLIGALKDRIFPQVYQEGEPLQMQGSRLMTEVQASEFVDELIENSYDNWRTKAYDKFQKCCQGIL